MTLTAHRGSFHPEIPTFISGTAITAAIDATGEKYSWTGSVYYHGSAATKDIEGVGFLFGTVTKGGGSAMTVSLQTAATAAGPPFQPDETQDQTVAIANADAGFVTGAWYNTGNLSANRTVSKGEVISVVIEYDGSGRLSTDTVSLSNYTANEGRFGGLAGGLAHKTGGTWALHAGVMNILLRFSDGTYGTLDGGAPTSVLATAVSFDSGSAADEHALHFQVPVECKCDGAWVLMLFAASTSNCDIVLYEGTTPRATASIDANTIAGTAITRLVRVSFAEVTIAANTDYYLSVKPTTTDNVSIYYFDVSAASHLQAHAGGEAFNYSTRVNGGSWAAATATRRMYAGVRLSSFHDGGGAGGGARIIGGTVVR